MTRKDFNNQEILKRLFDMPPICKICKVNAFKKILNLHHKDGDSSNDNWDNIVIYCNNHIDRLCYFSSKFLTCVPSKFMIV